MPTSIAAIFEWLKKEQKQENERPFLELPLEDYEPDKVKEEELDNRGPVVIDLI